MTTLPARIIHMSVAKPWREVYAFAAKPENMPRWAAGLGAGFRRNGDDWVADGCPIGTVRVDFTPPNDFGVLDHIVTMEDGARVHNALRVTPNADGAEVAFTVLRLPGMDDKSFEADCAAVRKDLETLRDLLEA